ncbi:hypothetical protein [Hymenobacter sp.]|uniref:hypothetical protein n=1 Tax=Hymenobacter sp. TaxID=1898978 RepID=UPI00286D17EF|nr:hypothetical protein [Hymenobacter sp.]
MKTYLLSIADEPTDRAVRAALADLLAKRLVTIESESDSAPPPTEAAIESDILQARQQPGISLSEAKTRFGL